MFMPCAQARGGLPQPKACGPKSGGKDAPSHIALGKVASKPLDNDAKLWAMQVAICRSTMLIQT